MRISDWSSDVCSSDLSTELQRRGPEMSGNKVMAVAMSVANRAVAQTPEGGALPQLYAAVAPEVSGGDYIGPGGLFELRGSPSKVRAAKRAYREADADRLWQVSEGSTGGEYRGGWGSREATPTWTERQ